MARIAALALLLFLPLSPPARAQDRDSHSLVATLPAPKPPWWLNGRYSIALTHTEDGEAYRMKLCPLRPSDLPNMGYATVEREFVAIARRVCRPGSVVMRGEVDYRLYVGHGDGRIDNIIADFTCLPGRVQP